MLSTILANPRDGGIHSSLQRRLAMRGGQPCYDDAMRVVSRATLIVVPVSLVGQWAEVRFSVRVGFGVVSGDEDVRLWGLLFFVFF